MTIYRGPGGTGSASSEVDTTEFQEFLVQAQDAKDAAEAARDAALAAETNAELAQASAELAEVNAETAEVNAELAETNAEAAASAAASSASAAATSASNASSSASSAAASAASIDPATLVRTTGDQTVAGVKTFSSNPALSGGTANGVAYLNGSKVLTSGSALTFDGAEVFKNSGGTVQYNDVRGSAAAGTRLSAGGTLGTDSFDLFQNSSTAGLYNRANTPMAFAVNNSEQMRLTSTGLGIGTSSPSSPLSIRSFGAPGRAADFNGSEVLFDGAGQFDLLIGDGGVAYMSLTTTDNATALKVRNYSGNSDIAVFERTTGNVGIGTSSPGFALDVYRASGSASYVVGRNGSGVQTAIGVAGDNGSLLGTLSNHNLRFVTNGAVVGTWDSSGNLGLGVTPPTIYTNRRALVIGGQTVASVYHYAGIGESAYNWYLDSGAAVKYATTNYAGTFEFNNSAVGGFAWKLAPSGTAGNAISFTQAMTLDSSGNLLVGTTSNPAISAGGYGILNALASAAGNNAIVASLQASATGKAFQSQSVTAAGTGWMHFYGASGNGSTLTTNNIFIYGNGNIQNANNSYGAISDAKLKENIVDTSPKLHKLNQVRIVNYSLIGDYEHHKQLGVIAQELEQIFPGMVEESPDRDAEGNDLGTTTKSVKYSVFVPMLIKALQEQQAIITALTARVEALEAA